MIRLIALITLLSISLLTVFKAPTYHLWLGAIAVTEFPFVLCAITIILLLAGFMGGSYRFAGTITGTIALLLFISPILRSRALSGTIKRELDSSFEIPASGKSDWSFSFFKLFKGKGKTDIAFKTLQYVSYADTTLALDFYPAAPATNKRPCVIVVHGGSWSSGDSQQLPELNNYLSANGYNVASINYRMAPKYQSPAPVEDVRAAISYLRENAGELNIDTSQFVLLGRSAGAQIALLAAYTLNDPGIKGVVDFYGPADMVWGYSIPANPLIMDSRLVMENYLGGTYQAVPKNYSASSPLLFVNKNSPPTLIIHGENDVLVAYEHSRRLNAKLQEFGVRHYFLSLPWATHGFDYNLNGPGGQISTYAVNRFLQSLTN